MKPTATIKYPVDAPAECTWVSGKISHLSRLGLSDEDLTVLARSNFDPEKKDFNTVLSRTLKDKYKEGTDEEKEASRAMLSKCTTPGSPDCTVETVHDAKYTFSTILKIVCLFVR